MEYRPNATLGVVLAGVFGVAAACLIWIGAILGPADVTAMDGTEKILFTVVPIRPFAWVVAAVFLFLALLILRRALDDTPSLILTADGATLPSGHCVPWAGVASASVPRDHLLEIGLAEGSDTQAPPSRRRRFGRGGDDRRITLSSFDLGADPAAVASEIERFVLASRRTPDASDGDAADRSLARLPAK